MTKSPGIDGNGRESGRKCGGGETTAPPMNLENQADQRTEAMLKADMSPNAIVWNGRTRVGSVRRSG